MASVTLTLSSLCAAQNHYAIAISGDATATVRGETSDVTAPITQDDIEAWLKVTLRIGKKTRTAAQLRNALQNGLTVTV